MQETCNFCGFKRDPKFLCENCSVNRPDDATLKTIIKAQSCKCALCLEPLSLSDANQLCVDRNSDNGKLRGIVCKTCKQLISNIENNRFNNRLWEYIYYSLDKGTGTLNPSDSTVYASDCITKLRELADESIDMIYVDPPFGTGKQQKLSSKKNNVVVSRMSYEDKFADYLRDFLTPCLEESKRILKSTGTLYMHLDHRYSHYAKVIMDGVFGKECFVNHIVWSYNYGGRGKSSFPKKHDDILVYSKVSGAHKFRWDQIDKVPYKAPDLQKDPVRAAMGQVPTDVWEMTIVPTNSKEKTGYPTQKPLKLIERAIRASTDPGDVVLDFCCGSGSTLVAAEKLGRKWVGIEKSQQALDVIEKRLQKLSISYTVSK